MDFCDISPSIKVFAIRAASLVSRADTDLIFPSVPRVRVGLCR